MVPPIELDKFAFRQFDDPDYVGTKIAGISKDEFMKKVLDYYSKRLTMEQEFDDHPSLVDGYAPFCKHIFMPNFLPDVVTPCVKITPENENVLRTRYEARKSSELPVLVRFFPASSIQTVPCKYLDLILYSREQIVKEAAATGDAAGMLGPAPWRLISVKAQDVPYVNGGCHSRGSLQADDFVQFLTLVECLFRNVRETCD